MSVSIPFDRDRAEAELSVYAGRRREWTRIGGGEFIYVPWTSWRANVTVGEAGFAWLFKSHDGSRDLGDGESASLTGMIRAVRNGPPSATLVPGSDPQAGGAG